MADGQVATAKSKLLRLGLFALLAVLALVLVADIYPKQRLKTVRSQAKAAGMFLVLPKPGPNDALPIYRRLGNVMERMPHNLKHADSNWPSQEPDLALQKRVWMQPLIKDVKLANERPTLSYTDPLSSDFLRLNPLVVGMCHEALWLAGEGKTDAAFQTLDQILDFVTRITRPVTELGRW